MFIDTSFHFAILHCSPVADTLENELLVNDLCKQSANDKHHFALHMEYDTSLTLWKTEKCFTKLGRVEEEHLSSRSACQKAALPYSGEQAIKSVL